MQAHIRWVQRHRQPAVKSGPDQNPFISKDKVTEPDFVLDEVLYRKPKPILTYPVKNQEVGVDGFVRDKPSRAERALEAQAKWFV